MGHRLEIPNCHISVFDDNRDCPGQFRGIPFISFNYYVEKMFGVIQIMDFNRTGPRCHSTIFPYANSG